MKILQVISSTDSRGGGPMEALRQVSDVLVEMGHHIEIASTDAVSSPWLTDLPFISHALGPGRTGYLYAPRFVPWLRENAGRFDAVVVHGLWQYTSYASWRALRSSGTPYFVYPHGMLDPWFKRAYPLKHLKKCLYWPWAEYRVLRDAKAVLFTCEEERLLARQSFGLYHAREAVVNFGTAGPVGDARAQREAFLSRYPTLQDKRLLLFLGRLHVKKGCDLLIEAFARVALANLSLHLVMAGPDQAGWRAELERRASALGVGDRILWPGMLTGDLKWGAFHAADAFVLPSHQENFGIAVAEALACGLPVLISNKINIWREIIDDGAGLVTEDTEMGTTRLLEDWLIRSEGERQEMRRNAKDSFARRYEIRQAAKSLLCVLEAKRETVLNQ